MFKKMKVLDQEIKKHCFLLFFFCSIKIVKYLHSLHLISINHKSNPKCTFTKPKHICLHVLKHDFKFPKRLR